MGAKRIRFAVGSGDDVRSSVWRLWAQKDEVYLGARTFLGTMKISFHRSGICRAAVISKTPRPALAKWNRPAQAAPGFTKLFAIVVPPDLVKGCFHQTYTEKKAVCFVPSPGDDQHKVVFSISVSSPHHTAQEVSAFLPRDRPFSMIGSVPLKTGIAWLHQYYDGFMPKERALIQGYVSGLKIHLNPDQSPSNAYLHWFDTENPQPHLVDIRLGTENETYDPPRKPG